MQSNLRYDPRAALRAACEQMLACTLTQLAEDTELSAAERAAAPVGALADAIRSGEDDALVAAGREAADWITRNAGEEERFEWAVGCPHPDIEQYETAAEQLGGGADCA